MARVDFGSTEADSSDTVSEMEGRGNMANKTNMGNSSASSSRAPHQTPPSKKDTAVGNINQKFHKEKATVKK